MKHLFYTWVKMFMLPGKFLFKIADSLSKKCLYFIIGALSFLLMPKTTLKIAVSSQWTGKDRLYGLFFQHVVILTEISYFHPSDGAAVGGIVV